MWKITINKKNVPAVVNAFLVVLVMSTNFVNPKLL